ncbi:NAD(P)(+)--arginine ADP-ribosyltransferase 2-like [Astyanax mexicanus]|uniref:NAD(P)(+)--arginine ADP-ribosyltransferase n=1 Tax=Astyanax mexicanus TaxID=7994 RepID=A0A3B1JBF3_ASTMX|nr:NAD(P)(+)--arginine ADP-ribosyltransferase 2-like [Astyanax mexicanus]
MICMKMTVCVVGVLLLMTAVTLAASISIWKISAMEYPLDMAENSVDDSYEGCRDAMEKLVLSKYTKQERKKTPGFAAAWKIALNAKKCSKEETFKKQCAAIYLYTGNPEINKNCSYIEFNAATRKGKAAYKSNSFQFYTLFFYLTDAVQQLKRKTKGCLTTYRRTNAKFPTNVRNKTIRFGSFTSTSLKEPPSRFGDKSCFEVETCFGADVTKYSKFPTESEVLVPPYEVFRVTKIKTKDKKNKNLWCKVVYELKSIKKMRSDLKCAKVK